MRAERDSSVIPSGWPLPERRASRSRWAGSVRGIPPADNSEATHAGREIPLPSPA